MVKILAKLQESQLAGKNPSLIHELKSSGASLSEEATPG
jgi:hypothetical protein